MTDLWERLDALDERSSELVERHEDGAGEGYWERYRGDPLSFITEECQGGDPTPMQVEIVEAFPEHRRIAVVSGQGIGKGWLFARMALYAVYVLDTLVLVTAPTMRQGIRGFMTEVARAFSPKMRGDLLTRELRLSREEHAGIMTFTSTESSAMTGFHAPRMMIVVDEAQGVDPFVWEAMESCAIGAEDRWLVAANPLFASGRVWEIARQAA